MAIMTMSSERPSVDGSVSRQIHVTLDLDEYQAADLADSIYEACSYVDNWRSNPDLLRRLESTVRELLGRPAPGNGEGPR